MEVNNYNTKWQNKRIYHEHMSDIFEIWEIIKQEYMDGGPVLEMRIEANEA